MKRFCELCNRLARMHCESDQAILCWDCDAKVHSANFLVARHSRYLLCQICQSPTPWSASGSVLAPTVSVCQQCVGYGRRCTDVSEDEEEEEEEIEEDAAAEEEVEENQVVPWSPPPAAEISSISEEPASVDEVVTSRKRCRIQNASPYPSPKDDHGCSSSELRIHAPTPPSDSAANASDSPLSKCQKTPPSKVRRTDLDRVGAPDSEILGSLRRLHREETGSGEQLAIDLNYPILLSL